MAEFDFKDFWYNGGCMAANRDDLDSYCPGYCAMKCTGEIDNKGGMDYQCNFMGHWKNCPQYVAGAELLDDEYIRSREPFRDSPGQTKFDFAEL